MCCSPISDFSAIPSTSQNCELGILRVRNSVLAERGEVRLGMCHEASRNSAVGEHSEGVISILRGWTVLLYSARQIDERRRGEE